MVFFLSLFLLLTLGILAASPLHQNEPPYCDSEKCFVEDCFQLTGSQGKGFDHQIKDFKVIQLDYLRAKELEVAGSSSAAYSIYIDLARMGHVRSLLRVATIAIYSSHVTNGAGLTKTQRYGLNILISFLQRYAGNSSFEGDIKRQSNSNTALVGYAIVTLAEALEVLLCNSKAGFSSMFEGAFNESLIVKGIYQWYKSATEMGNADAAFRLFHWHLKGEYSHLLLDGETYFSLPWAYKYCRCAADKGHTLARKVLSVMNGMGLGNQTRSLLTAKTQKNDAVNVSIRSGRIIGKRRKRRPWLPKWFKHIPHIKFDWQINFPGLTLEEERLFEEFVELPEML